MSNSLFEKALDAFLDGKISWLDDSIRAMLLDLDDWGSEITGASNDAPIVITTATPHGAVDGDTVNILGVNGITTANGAHKIAVIDDSHFRLLDTTGNGSYLGGGRFINLSQEQYVSDIPSAARVAISPELTNKSIERGVLKADDVTFGTVAGPDILEAAVLFQDSGLLTSSRLLLYLDQGVNLPLAPNGSVARLIWDPEGIVGL